MFHAGIAGFRSIFPLICMISGAPPAFSASPLIVPNLPKTKKPRRCGTAELPVPVQIVQGGRFHMENSMQAVAEIFGLPARSSICRRGGSNDSKSFVELADSTSMFV
jgi:hypothetical protein